MSKAKQGLELDPLGHKISTIVNIQLVLLQKAHKIHSEYVAIVYDTFMGWVGGLTVILRPVSAKLDCTGTDLLG